MRTDAVYLPLSYTKCVPMVHACPQSGMCARTICKADKGRPLEDFSNSYIWVRGRCVHFLAASNFREPPKDKPQGPRDAVEGMA